MAAAPYFITAQLALIAISAYLVQSEAPASAASPEAEPKPAPRLTAVNPGLAAATAVAALPSASIERYVPAEKIGIDDAEQSRGISARPMGTTQEDGHARKEFDFGREPRAASVKKAPADEPPEFDPVPENAGYHIDADAVTNFDLNTRTMVFSGNVTLECADFTLSSKHLVAHMGEAGSALKKLVANGNVEVHVKGETKEDAFRGRGEEAVFDPATGKIMMGGWPKIIGQGREHNAASASTVMTLDTRKPKLQTTGRAQTRLLMDGKGGMPGISMGPPSAPAPPRQP